MKGGGGGGGVQGGRGGFMTPKRDYHIYSNKCCAELISAMVQTWCLFEQFCIT